MVKYLLEKFELTFGNIQQNRKLS